MSDTSGGGFEELCILYSWNHPRAENRGVVANCATTPMHFHLEAALNILPGSSLQRMDCVNSSRVKTVAAAAASYDGSAWGRRWWWRVVWCSKKEHKAHWLADWVGVYCLPMEFLLQILGGDEGDTIGYMYTYLKKIKEKEKLCRKGWRRTFNGRVLYLYPKCTFTGFRRYFLFLKRPQIFNK